MAEPEPEFSIEALEEIKKLIKNASNIVIEQGISQVKEPLKEIVPYLSGTFRDAIPAEALKELFELVDVFMDVITDVLSPVTDVGFNLVFQPLDVDEENPYAAAEAIQKALIRVVTMLGIIAMLPELAHPLKELGLGRITPAIVEIGGFNTIASSISSVLVERTAIAPLRYALNRKLTPYIPGQQDLIQFTVKEDLGYEWLRPYLSKHGFSDEWAAHYWDSHWRLPAINNLYDMYYKGLISEQVLLRMLVRHDYNPADKIPGTDEVIDWPQKFLENSYTPLPRVDLRFAYESDIIDRQGVHDRMKALGYSPENTLIETEVQIRRSLENERDDVRRQYQTDFQQGWLTEDDLTAILVELDYNPDKINYYIAKSKITRAREFRNDQQYALSLAFRQNKISEDEFRLNLTDLGMVPEAIDNVIFLELMRRKAPKEDDTAPELTVSQLGRLYQEGKLTERDFVLALAAKGYVEEDIQRILILYSPFET